ncbi:MAG: Hsp33 family molecular chaperone HslO [Clostridia bacterium]|nr:Hsp33 family molecular chaperone HslO [Clostridia bacterium]MBQ3062322.1 Hsp33 family molecular chaperone HslO [Clostridia bacterium]
MKDYIVRGITNDGFIKASAVQSTQMVERMRQIHGTTPLATAALGRTLTAASMMGDELKDKNGSVTIRINGGGPLGSLIAVSDNEGNVRGYVQDPNVDLPLKSVGKLNVGAGVGTDGILTVIKDIGEREPFNGQVQLLTGEIAEDIAYYYYISEQIPTLCALGVLVDRDYTVKQAGGYIIQLLPGAPEELAFILEERVKEEAARGRSVTSMMEEGMDAKQILEYMLDGMGYRELYQHEVEYQCKCSRERVEQAVISIGREELTRLYEEEESVKVTCQFCDKEYVFTKEDINEMLLRPSAESEE